MSWERINLADPEYAKPAERPRWCDLIYAGKRHVLSGPPESLKTMLALIVLLEALRDGVTVALIDFEIGPPDTRRMLAELGATLEEIAAVHYFEPETAPTDADIAAIIEAGVGLVVIDAALGAYSISGLDDGKRVEAEQFAQLWIRPLFDAGVATLVVDHVTKAAGSRGAFAIGSERKIGAADVHLGAELVGVSFSRGGHATVKITTHKDRPGFLNRPRAAELELRSDPDTHAINWDFRAAEPRADAAGDPWRPTVLMERVSRFLEGQSEPVSRKQVEEGVKGKGEYVRQALDVLIREGSVRETPGGRGARLVELLRPFEEADLVPTSSRPNQLDLVPTSSLEEPHNGAGFATSSQLVPTSSPTRDDLPRPISSPPTRGTRTGDEVEQDEIERLAATYGEEFAGVDDDIPF